MEHVQRFLCLQLPDGSLIPLEPFKPPTEDELAKWAPGNPLFCSYEQLEADGGQFVMATVVTTTNEEIHPAE